MVILPPTVARIVPAAGYRLRISTLKVVVVAHHLTGNCDHTQRRPAQALAIERINHGAAQSATAGDRVVLG